MDYNHEYSFKWYLYLQPYKILKFNDFHNFAQSEWETKMKNKKYLYQKYLGKINIPFARVLLKVKLL